MKTLNTIAVGVLLAGGALGAFAEDCLTDAVSGDGRNRIRLWANPLSYDVSRDGVCVVGRTPIGLALDGSELKPALAKPLVTRDTPSGQKKTVFYKRETVDLAQARTHVDFGGWGVTLVARKDGVAYRFETARPGSVRVTGETAGVTIPDAKAACTFYVTGSDGCEESVGDTKSADLIRTEGSAKVYLPLFYRVGGKAVVVSESDVFDYPIWNLKRSEGTAGGVPLAGEFARWPSETANNSGVLRSAGAKRERQWRVRKRLDYMTETSGTRTYPWRTFILADTPAKAMEADLVYALAREAKGDFSWVKPGKVAWDWWNAFDNIGDPVGCTTKTYERFIDFASKNGVEYVIFDEGWSEKLDIWHFSPRVDVPHLIDYAAKRNVGIILWMAWAQVQGDEERVAEHFAKMGAKGFKVDFMDRGDAEVERFLWTFAEACAKRKMLVDYHGAHRPTGMSRAYPNVINYEGVHGLEMMKFHRGEDMLGNDVRIVFTRLMAGPMDYTPGAMDNYAIGTYPVCKGWNTSRFEFTSPGSLGTRARQMAMLALYEAPLQMLCDSPTKYEKNPECFAFMAKVPTAWRDLVALGGDPESFAAVARKADNDTWYAAGLCTAKPCDIAFEADFLGAGEWSAEIFRDAPDSDKTPSHYVHETKGVAKGAKMAFRLAPGGGFVVRFSRKR